MLYSELRKKDVINVCDCKKLGRVVDMEIDECRGQICKLIVGKGGKFCGFLVADCDIVIPIGDVKQIGPDIILVSVKS